MTEKSIVKKHSIKLCTSQSNLCGCILHVHSSIITRLCEVCECFKALELRLLTPSPGLWTLWRLPLLLHGVIVSCLGVTFIYLKLEAVVRKRETVL